MICVFDLDGTLAELGKGVTDADRNALLALEARGHTIVLCSGKPTYYLCGFARQLGLSHPILLGENGASGQFGVDLPPKRRWLLPIDEQVLANIEALRALVTNAFAGRLWCQPNEVSFTPFPETDADFAVIEDLLAAHPDRMQGVSCYRHCDSFDIVPAVVNKGAGLAYLAELLGTGADEFVAIGNGVNDYTMFDFAAWSVGISLPAPTRATYAVNTSAEALQILLKKLA